MSCSCEDENARDRCTSALHLQRCTSQLFDDGEDFVLAHDHEFFAVELDFGAGVAGEDDFVAFFDAERGAFAGVEALAFADG